MTIQLMPEDEQLIQERLRSGVFHTGQEVVHHALQVQKAEESVGPAPPRSRRKT